MTNKKCLLLVGSPRGWQSSSFKVGEYLLNSFVEKGYTGDKYLLAVVSKMIDNRGKENSTELNEFITAVRESDIVIMSCPLYVDSLPSFVIKAMEFINEEYKKSNKENIDYNNVDKQIITQNRQGFLSIVNSGFPESEQNNIALRICQSFANEAGFKWLGGIGICGGPAIGNKQIEGNSGMLKNLISGLDKAAEDIARDKKITEDTLKLLNRGLIPKWFYTLLLNPSWWFMARKNGANKDLYSKPNLIRK